MLNLQKIPHVDDMPHVTWCCTGPLAFLPLHTAGIYDDPRSMIFNHVISSYTPTLSVLLASPPPPDLFSGVLAVGQSVTAGFSDLPGTTKELDVIQGLTAGLPLTRLEADLATPAAVLARMEDYSWVHLACHATQNPSDPTKSAFYLHGGTLDLTTIAQRPLKNAQLAFLSACQTATGDEKLSEEAVHLAAGMIMAGYPAVIATMWSIQDQDAPLIAEKVYAHLLKGEPDARKAAKALHIATGLLREKVGLKAVARWAPYIHIGR
jgi:CHAT domain-containing protein